MQLTGKNVLLTGANGGLGQALIEACLAAGAAHVYGACRNPDNLPLNDPRVTALALDVTDTAQIRRVIELALPVDVLINNAGLNRQQKLLGTTQVEAASEEMAVNYFATLNLIRGFAPTLIQRRGAIINVLSILARVSIPAMGSLCASKAAAFRLSESVAAELVGQVSVMAVLPGVIDTAMSRDFPGDKASPQAIAQAIVEGLHAEQSVLYPDAMAQGVAAGLSADRAAVVGELSKFV